MLESGEGEKGLRERRTHGGLQHVLGFLSKHLLWTLLGYDSECKRRGCRKGKQKFQAGTPGIVHGEAERCGPENEA